MGTRFEDEKLIMEGDGISDTYAVKTLPPPPDAEAMAFYFRAYFDGYQSSPEYTNVDFSRNPWDRVIAFGLSHEGIVPSYGSDNRYYAPGFFGLIGEELNIKNPNLDSRYKQAEALLSYNAPQEGDTLWIPTLWGLDGVRFTSDSNKEDEWGSTNILYYRNIDEFVLKISRNHLKAERVGVNQVRVMIAEDTSSRDYLGENGNNYEISSEGSDTRPTIEKPFSGGATHFFSSAIFGSDEGRPQFGMVDGSLNHLPNGPNSPSRFDFPERPLPLYPYNLTTDPNLAKLVTYVWMIENAGDGIVFRFGVNMEGFSIDDISLARTSPKTYWAAYGKLYEEHIKVYKFNLDPTDGTWGIFDDGEGNMKFPGYIVMKFPEKSSGRKFILDHYKIEYFNRC